MKPASALFTTLSSLLALSAAQETNSTVPTRMGMVLFPAFQALDVFGPLDILNLLSLRQHLNLFLIAPTMDPVSTQPRMPNAFNSSFHQSILPTHTFADPPEDLDVLFVPGGIGTRAPQEELQEMIDYVADTYPSLQHLVSVCTGAGIVARAGVLDGLNATTNKNAWAQTTALGPRTNWIGKARWVVDGNVYTSSGVSAGIDATFAYIAEVWGEETAESLAIGIEHNRVKDPSDDPFAAIHGVEDVPPVEAIGGVEY